MLASSCTTLAPAAPQGAERHRHREKHRLQPTLVPECREDRRMCSFLCTWQQSLPFHAFGPQDVQTPWVPASYPPSGWSSSDSLYAFPLYPLANCRPRHHSVYTLTRVRTCPWISVCTHLRTCPHIQVSTWLCTQVTCVYTDARTASLCARDLEFYQRYCAVNSCLLSQSSGL